MRMSKLTLSADPQLVERGKRFATAKGTSLSSLFSRFLEALLREQEEDFRPGPITRRATGLARLPRGKSDRQLLEDALAEGQC